MRTHLDLAKGYYTGNKEEHDKLWAELAQNLNAYGPPTRTVRSWKRVCTLVSHTKMKTSVHKELFILA